MRKNCLSFLLIFSIFTTIQGQSDLLKQYIQEGLQSNIALQQKELSYEKSLQALAEAKAMFFPKLSLEARYSLARGGRTSNIAVGDLMNPVYANLNLINETNRASIPNYPTLPSYNPINNQSINFLRETEHETKLRLVFPVFNAAIRNNHKIKKQLTDVEKISVNIYKRELVKEIKTAYLNYLKAKQAVELFTNTKKLVNENLRTSKSLYNNNKLTIDVVYAAEVEVKKVEQQLAEAEKNQKIAKAYFNFLLNKNQESSIQISKEDIIVSTDSFNTAKKMGQQNREELKQLDHYLNLSDKNVNLQKAEKLPQLNLVADYGFQGTKYSFTSEDDYAMGSLVLSWNLFNKPVKSKVEQAVIEKKIIQQKKLETQQQINLQITTAFYDLEAALKTIDLAKSEVASAKKAYKLVSKKFNVGKANLVELTNARTQMTNAEQNLIITQYDYQIKVAALERVTGTYSFE